MTAPGVGLKGRVRDQGRGVGFRVWARVPGEVVMIPGSCFGSLFGDWKEVALCSSSVSQSLEALQQNLHDVAVYSVLNGLLRKGRVGQRG